METRKLILLMIFTMSLMMLWDNYQVYQGKPGLFGMSTQANKADGTKVAAKPGDNELPTAVQAPSTSASAGELPQATPVAPAQLVKVRNDVFELEFSTQGAQWVASRLLNFKDSTVATKPVQLFEQSANRTYLGQFGLVGGSTLPNHRSTFEWIKGPTELAPGQPKLDVQFKSVGQGVEVIYTYTLYPGKYQVDFKADVKNVGEQAVSPNFYAQITRDDKPLPDESKFYSTFTGPAFYTPQSKYQKVDFKSIEKGNADFVKETDAGWLAMIQHYFVSAIVPQAGARSNYTRKLETGLYAAGSLASLGAINPGQTVAYTAKLYSGPQDQHTLEALSPGLELVVDYGWLTVIAKPIYWLLEKIHGLVSNWGWSIILLTVLIKALFYPLAAASYKSMAKMRQVAPRMQKLKEQYGDDKMGFQRAMMEMYQREKINPLGGCMPILIQIPVFISLYWVLLASVEMRGAPWLGWITDLATPDPYYILPVIMAVTMFIQTKLNPTPPDPVQAKVMMIMPLVFSVMFLFFPSGLVLYWVVNNILSIAQQWAITRQVESGSVK